MIEVEEDRARGVADIVDARLLGDVLEVPLAVVHEEVVPLADGGDEEVRMTVVVDVGEGGGDADLVLEPHPGLRGDIAELAVAEVLPELVLAELGDEVDVEETVAVHVRHRQTVAVVVVDRLVEAGAVVRALAAEGDAALRQAIGELEVVEDADLLGGGELRGLAHGQSRHPLVVIGVVVDVGAGGRVGLVRGLARDLNAAVLMLHGSLGESRLGEGRPAEKQRARRQGRCAEFVGAKRGPLSRHVPSSRIGIGGNGIILPPCSTSTICPRSTRA